jgi:hypothetical protein
MYGVPGIMVTEMPCICSQRSFLGKLERHMAGITAVQGAASARMSVTRRVTDLTLLRKLQCRQSKPAADP